MSNDETFFCNLTCCCCWFFVVGRIFLHFWMKVSQYASRLQLKRWRTNIRTSCKKVTFNLDPLRFEFYNFLHFRTKLPSAVELLGCPKATIAPENNPALHGGRIRAFAHERGNWASYCYFKFNNHIILIRDLCEAIQKCCQDAELAISLNPIEEVHLSLTRTFVLRHHWIEPFGKSLNESLSKLRTKNAWVYYAYM